MNTIPNTMNPSFTDLITQVTAAATRFQEILRASAFSFHESFLVHQPKKIVTCLVIVDLPVPLFWFDLFWF